MEYLDILNEDGSPSNEVAIREAAHKRGLWHKIAHIWIMNSNGKVLIQKRSPQKETYPNMWSMSCEGHISAGQTPIEGALRELKEELGLDIAENQIELLFTYKRSATYSENYIGNHFIDVYLVRADLNIREIKIQEEELSEIKWYSFEDYVSAVSKNDPNFRDYPGELEKLPAIFEKQKSFFIER